MSKRVLSLAVAALALIGAVGLSANPVSDSAGKATTTTTTTKGSGSTTLRLGNGI
jgi:hypothetical protein